MKPTNAPAARLGSYLAAVLGAGTLPDNATAAIVNLDVSSIDGINPPSGIVSLSSLSPQLTGTFYIRNNPSEKGLARQYATRFATGYGYAEPRNFSSGQMIDSSAYFSRYFEYSLFLYDGDNTSPAFNAGSFMGFRSSSGHYGWLEVTWDPFTGDFEIHSGAFEDQVGVGIPAGAMAAVPEPAGAFGTLGLLAAGSFVRRRRQAA